jgi:hypothetical protein
MFLRVINLTILIYRGTHNNIHIKYHRFTYVRIFNFNNSNFKRGNCVLNSTRKECNNYDDSNGNYLSEASFLEVTGL